MRHLLVWAGRCLHRTAEGVEDGGRRQGTKGNDGESWGTTGDDGGLWRMVGDGGGRHNTVRPSPRLLLVRQVQTMTGRERDAVRLGPLF